MSRSDGATPGHAATDGPVTILVGDIGGTNTRLNLFRLLPTDRTGEDQRPPGTLLKQQVYRNDGFATFEDVVSAFFFEAEPVTALDEAPVAGCLAVAGPAPVGGRRSRGKGRRAGSDQPSTQVLLAVSLSLHHATAMVVRSRP